MTLSLGTSALADTDVGVEEHLGQTIPLDLAFNDEAGRPVLLQELVDKPTILNLVYYGCPGICGPLLGGIAAAIDQMDLLPGKDYRVITISFDEHETPLTAQRKKENFIKTLKRPIDHSQWSFLTGSLQSIKSVSDAAGFYFKRVDGEFVHPAVIMVLSRSGKIARYLYGTSFLPLDLTLSIMEATAGRSAISIKKLGSYCFKYDPRGRTYIFRILPIIGLVMLIAIGAFGVYLLVAGRQKRHAL